MSAKLRHMLMLIGLDQHADDFHEGREWMRFVFTYRVNQGIKYSYELLIFMICVGHKKDWGNGWPYVC